MSTRSGKCIHGFIDENGLDKVTEPKTERKTRAKSQKENYPEVVTEKKRKHYVRYPSEEDIAAGLKAIDEPIQSVRKSRRNTLKEKNTLSIEADTTSDERKNRQIRRAKRILDSSKKVVPSVEPNEQKKDKRKTKTQLTSEDSSEPVQATIMKKSNKKKNKRKSSSIVVEDNSENNNHILNKNNTTNDSFYSAAGSIIDNDYDEINKDIILSLPLQNSSNTANIDCNNIELNVSKTKSVKKKRKSSSTKAVNKSINSSMTNNDENINRSSIEIEINQPEVHNTTLIDNINSSPILNNTLKDTSKRNRISSIIDTTNDADANLSVNNTTFEMETVVSSEQVGKLDNSIVLNNTYSTEKRRKSFTTSQTNISTSNLNATFIASHDIGEMQPLCTETAIIHVRGSSKKKPKSSIKSLAYDDKDLSTNSNFDTTYEKESSKQSLDQLDKQGDIQDGPSGKSRHSTKHSFDHVDSSVMLNSTYDKTLKTETPNSHNSTYIKSKNNTPSYTNENFKLNSTFNKSQASNLSIISSDVTDNMTSDTSKDNSRISLTSDESRTENIVNTTPVLIESSMDDSQLNNNCNVNMEPRQTPFKQGIFVERKDTTPSKYGETFNESKGVMSPASIRRQKKTTTPLKNEETHSDVQTKTPLKREGTYTEIKSSTPPLKREGTYTEIKTPLKREGTYTEIKTPLKREGTYTEIKTPLKREGTYTEIKTPLKREGTYTEIKTPLKREGTYTEILPAAPPLQDCEILNKSITPIKSGRTLDEKHDRTPLKRDGTFTKDDSIASESPKVNLNKTPERRKSLPSPGCTPFPLSKSSTKKSVLNVTRSIEKSSRRSSVDLLPRATKVMFCSPVDNPAILSQVKAKVIKSNLKGSNKSFLFDSSVSEHVRLPRKRSYTHSEAEDSGVKRKRLTNDQQQSVDRLSRPRTTSASAKLQDAFGSSKNELTPSKVKLDAKVSRTKLPNFAALHQRRFAKMESLDECQERKAKRARELLTPTAPTVLEKTNPREPDPATSNAQPKKTETPKTSTQPIDISRGYTRFGFKLNLDVNPFSIPSKTTEIKPKKATKPVQREKTLPSLTGATNARREIAKQTVMREKSFSERRNEKRKENRTIIKGVRTNRRFELQMQMRNVT